MKKLKDVYHRDTYQFGELPDSYWGSTASIPDFPSLQEDVDADVAIIGGGITGLVSALKLAKQFGKTVVVLEAGRVGWGASGRAGGFNSGMASKLSLEGMCTKYGIDAARNFADQQYRATELIYKLARDEDIDIEATGEGVVVAATSKRAALDLQMQPKVYRQIAGKEVEYLSEAEFKSRIHGGVFVCGGLHIHGGGGIHPLKYTVGLARAAACNGAQLYCNSRVLDWCKVGKQHVLRTAEGSISAHRVVVATNAYTSDHLNSELNRRVLPLISSILVTRPLEHSELERAGFKSTTPVYTSNNKLFYYRLLPDNRFLIGGRGDTIGSRAARARKADWLDTQFRKMFPCWKHVDVSYQWDGLVCVTRRGVPALGCLSSDPSIGYALGCHGSGLNNATWMGIEQARIMASDDPEKDALRLPEIVRKLPPRIYGPRRSAINAALVTYSAIDAWSNRPLWTSL